MITNDGKQIIAKYMLGQAPTFATHIAAGVGPEALITGASASISPDKKSLDFEVFRVPILSRGFIKDGEDEKLVFKAQMPNDQRYKITEIGLFPGANNVVAGRYDSKMLITFSPGEPWTYSNGVSASIVTYPNIPIDQGNVTASVNSSTPEFVFINSDSTIFDNSDRKNKQEPPRFLNRAMLANGAAAYLNSSFVPQVGSRYLQNSNVNIDLSQNLPDDEIKIAFSIIGRYTNSNDTPDDIRILVEFVNNLPNIETEPPKAYAEFSTDSVSVAENRYQVLTKKISDFTTDPTFSWANINLIKIYSSMSNLGVADNNYFFLFDGIRIDNVTATNPLYSLVGYNLITTNDSYPVLKEENTNNFIEYRFGIGVS
jgi:hypothetical protein